MQAPFVHESSMLGRSGRSALLHDMDRSEIVTLSSDNTEIMRA